MLKEKTLNLKMKPISNSKCWNEMNTLTRNNISTAFINVTNGLLLLSITISFQQSCLKMGHLEYLHKAILKLHAQVIDILCVLLHFICCCLEHCIII